MNLPELISRVAQLPEGSPHYQRVVAALEGIDHSHFEPLLTLKEAKDAKAGKGFKGKAKGGRDRAGDG
jgi:hypothetical protein